MTSESSSSSASGVAEDVWGVSGLTLASVLMGEEGAWPLVWGEGAEGGRTAVEEAWSKRSIMRLCTACYFLVH